MHGSRHGNPPLIGVPTVEALLPREQRVQHALGGERHVAWIVPEGLHGFQQVVGVGVLRLQANGKSQRLGRTVRITLGHAAGGS